MNHFTLVGGRVVDPASGRDEVTNLQVADGRIVSIGEEVAGTRVDVTGLVVAPGLVDLHVHLREPGGEAAETIATGTMAAAAGGYTAVFAMPNTDPVTDGPQQVARIREIARREASCDVHPVGAITVGQLGTQLVDVPAMAAAGVRYLSDDGHPVASASMMRDALTSAAAAGIVVGNHSEEPTLTVGAQLNEGPTSRRMGLAGWPREAEDVMVARDLILAGGLGARLHVPHLSTSGAVDLVREAKSRGVRVTAEVTPHHMALTDELAEGWQTEFKVNPPLRTARDVTALHRGLADGTIEVIATDHAPHAAEQKGRPWADAPCGMVGSETALAVTITELVTPGTISLSTAIDRLSRTPARVMGLRHQGGPLVPGAAANLTVFDLHASWTVDPDRLHTRGRNSPFSGRTLRGRVVHTLLRGEFTFRDGRPTGSTGASRRGPAPGVPHEADHGV
jgi:dihydroorotase